MNKKQLKIGYSTREVDVIMRKYIKKSAERLASNLKVEWKKTSKLGRSQYVKH